jgi:glucose-1-phosphate adenylyltransferase
VEKDAMVESTILMPGAVVEEGAEVYYSIIAENVTIKKGAVVGARPENVEDKSKWGVAVIGKGVTVKKGTKIEPKAMYDGEKEDGRK